MEDSRRTQELLEKSGGNISEDTIIQQSDILRELPETSRSKLSDHIYGIISHNPPKFTIAHKEYKQIIYVNLKKNQKIKIRFWSINSKRYIVLTFRK